MQLTRGIRISAGVLGLAGLMFARPASANLQACSAAVDKIGLGLVKSLEGSLQKCKAAYREGLNVNGKAPDTVADAALACEKEMKKSVRFGQTCTAPAANVGARCSLNGDCDNPAGSLNGVCTVTGSNGTKGQQSAKNKAYASLAKLLLPAGANPAACDDNDLFNLGHLPPGTFGDKWARWILMAKQKGAIEDQLWLIGDTMNIFQALFNTGLCPDCEEWAHAGPCAKHACVLGGGSSTCVDTTTLDIPLALTGVNILEICRAPNILPGDLGVVGNPARGLDPVNLGGGTFACVKGIRAEGYVNGVGSTNPAVNTFICQDHRVPPTAGEIGNECPNFGPGCGPDTPDTEPGHLVPPVTNSGPCVTLIPALAIPGDSFVLNTTQISVIFAGQEGPDTVPCTGDDTGTPGVPAIIPLTTHSAQAQLYDADNVNGAILPNGPTCPNPAILTGAPFDPVAMEASIFSGGTYVGAFPALHALFGPPRIDTITTFTFQCN
jgi:hypothetical protein